MLTKSLENILKGFNKTINDLRTYAEAQDAQADKAINKAHKLEEKIDLLFEKKDQALSESVNARKIADNLENLLKG